MALLLARGEAHFPFPYQLLEIKILFQMDVFNISASVMCPAQKGNYGKQGTEVREMRNDQTLSPIRNAWSSEAWLIGFHTILNSLQPKKEKTKAEIPSPSQSADISNNTNCHTY